MKAEELTSRIEGSLNTRSRIAADTKGVWLPVPCEREGAVRVSAVAMTSPLTGLTYEEKSNKRKDDNLAKLVTEPEQLEHRLNRHESEDWFEQLDDLEHLAETFDVRLEAIGRE